MLGLAKQPEPLRQDDMQNSASEENSHEACSDKKESKNSGSIDVHNPIVEGNQSNRTVHILSEAECVGSHNSIVEENLKKSSISSTTNPDSVSAFNQIIRKYFPTISEAHLEVIRIGALICPFWFLANCLYNYSLLMTSNSSSTIIRLASLNGDLSDASVMVTV